MRRSKNKIWNKMVVSAVLAVVCMSGCGSVAANVEDVGMQQSFSGSILNKSVQGGDSADGEALSDARDLQTEVV